MMNFFLWLLSFFLNPIKSGLISFLPEASNFILNGLSFLSLGALTKPALEISHQSSKLLPLPEKVKRKTNQVFLFLKKNLIYFLIGFLILFFFFSQKSDDSFYNEYTNYGSGKRNFGQNRILHRFELDFLKTKREIAKNEKEQQELTQIKAEIHKILTKKKKKGKDLEKLKVLVKDAKPLILTKYNQDEIEEIEEELNFLSDKNNEIITKKLKASGKITKVITSNIAKTENFLDSENKLLNMKKNEQEDKIHIAKMKISQKKKERLLKEKDARIVRITKKLNKLRNYYDRIESSYINGFTRFFGSNITWFVDGPLNIINNTPDKSNRVYTKNEKLQSIKKEIEDFEKELKNEKEQAEQIEEEMVMIAV